MAFNDQKPHFQNSSNHFLVLTSESKSNQNGSPNVYGSHSPTSSNGFETSIPPQALSPNFAPLHPYFRQHESMHHSQGTNKNEATLPAPFDLPHFESMTTSGPAMTTFSPMMAYPPLSESEIRQYSQHTSGNGFETFLQTSLSSNFPYYPPLTNRNKPILHGPGIRAPAARSPHGFLAPTSFSPMKPYPPLSENEISRRSQETSRDGFEEFLKFAINSPFPSYTPSDDLDASKAYHLSTQARDEQIAMVVEAMRRNCRRAESEDMDMDDVKELEELVESKLTL